jgi:hypothetical protein
MIFNERNQDIFPISFRGTYKAVQFAHPLRHNAILVS